MTDVLSMSQGTAWTELVALMLSGHTVASSLVRKAPRAMLAIDYKLLL